MPSIRGAWLPQLACLACLMPAADPTARNAPAVCVFPV
jgi:hypothetical protein